MQLKETTAYARHLAIRKMQANGCTAVEYLAALDAWLKDEPELRASLSKMTVPELKRHTWRAAKKDEMVETILINLFDGFLDWTGKGGYTVDYFHGETPHMAIIREAKKATDEALAAYAAKFAKDVATVKKAVTDPETEEEYRILIQRVGEDRLKPEQQEVWDGYCAQRVLAAAAARMEQAAKVGKIELDDDVHLIVTPGVHTKHQCPIWTVKPSRYMGDDWKDLNEKARRFGARWSTYGAQEMHGWIFFNESDCAAFLDLQNGDGTVLERWQRREQERVDRATERLAEAADTLEARAQAELDADRKTNTARRADAAIAALNDAARDMEWVSVLRSISDALDSVVYLRHLRFVTQVRTLETILQQAKYKAIRSAEKSELYDPDRWNRQPVLADIYFAEYPFPWVDTYTLRDALAAVKGRRGSVSLTRSLNGHDGRCKSEGETIVFKELAEMSASKGMKSALQDYERLKRMGLDDIHTLRAALREYMMYRIVKPCRPDQARIMELNLVGSKIPGFFPTPPWLADKMVEALDIKDGMLVLDPSAGSCRLLEAVKRACPGAVLRGVEINWTLRELARVKGFQLLESTDFMSIESEEVYDRIIMNPPFEKGQDMQHIRHAYNFLKPGGRLVAITSPHWRFADDQQSQYFRTFVESFGYAEDLGPGVFKDAGTDVSTMMVVLSK